MSVSIAPRHCRKTRLRTVALVAVTLTFCGAHTIVSNQFQLNILHKISIEIYTMGEASGGEAGGSCPVPYVCPLLPQSLSDMTVMCALNGSTSHC